MAHLAVSGGLIVGSGGGLWSPDGSGGPAAPTDFFVTLQGQSGQNTSIFNPGGTPSFDIPDQESIYLGWPDAVPGSAPIDHYELQNSTDGGSTWNTPSGGSSIGTGAPDSQGTRYKDLSLTNCVSSSYGPTAGQYLPATIYMHRLRAVDTNSVASAWITGANQYLYNGATGGTSSATGGFKWVTDLSSGYTINYATTDPTYTYVATIDMSSGGGGYWLPCASCNYCTFNQQIGACNYFYALLSTSNASMNIGMNGEVVGDLAMEPGGAPAGNLNAMNQVLISNYVVGGTVIANTYQLYKIPLAHFMVPQTGFAGSGTSIGVLQKSMYKFLWQTQIGAVVKVAKAWFGL